MAVFLPVSVLFSDGYSEALCSPNFPASSPGTHGSCVYTVASLPPYHCARAALRLQSEQWPSNSQSRNLIPFPVSFSAHVLLPGQSFSVPSPASYFVVHMAARISLLPSVPFFLHLSASYSISSFQSFQRLFSICFKDTVTGIGAFQVLNELTCKSGFKKF